MTCNSRYIYYILKNVCINIYKGNGVYTIVTTEEFIIVNGIIASSFGANHMMANLYYNIHRFIYALSPSLLTSSLLHKANEKLGMMIPFFGPVKIWISVEQLSINGEFEYQKRNIAKCAQHCPNNKHIIIIISFFIRFI
jgi:hypothetical protein